LGGSSLEILRAWHLEVRHKRKRPIKCEAGQTIRASSKVKKNPSDLLGNLPCSLERREDAWLVGGGGNPKSNGKDRGSTPETKIQTLKKNFLVGGVKEPEKKGTE